MEQEKRVAKALRVESDLVWTKTPVGWYVTTPSGGRYLVHRNACQCGDYKHRCAGTEMVCYHIICLRRKLAAAEQRAQAEPKTAAMSEEEAARFDKLYC